MKKSRLAMTALGALILLVLLSCDLTSLFGGQKVASNVPVFSVDLFEDNIRDFFTGGSVGFTYAIAVQGTLERSGAAGEGRAVPDGGIRAMNVNDRMHVASVSKTVTTIAVLRLIQDTPGLGLNSSISPYLPTSWAPFGPGVSSVTFEDLLLHQSGFSLPANQSRFTDADLATIIRTGVVNDSNPTYSNAHHNLFRVMVSKVLGAPKLAGETDEDYHARIFGSYVDTVIFDELSIDASVTPPPSPNLYYAWPDDGTGGLGTDGNWTYSTDFGAYGWYLSAIDLAKILSYLHYTEDLISEETRETMNQEEMGYWNSRTGDKGRYLMKQGGWFYTVGSAKGMQSIIGHFPGGIDAAVIVNSRPAFAYNMANVLRDAFDDSFVAP